MISFARCGVVVGHSTDVDGATGCTVVLGVDAPLRGGVHILGRATGTREISLLEPSQLVDRVDAIFLTGGSAYGLDAAAGVMRWMEERSRGFPVGDGVVPIVPAATIFDLAPLGRFASRPTPAMAYQACEAASAISPEGSIGAGTGATVGKIAGSAGSMKGGIGTGCADAGEVHVCALAVVNALGDIRNAQGGIIAGARRGDGSFIDTASFIAGADSSPSRFDEVAGRNTTLGVVITNAQLDRVQLNAVARAASAAMYRRITPVGTAFDGDVIFTLAPIGDGVRATSAQVEALAILALEQAIERSVGTSAPGETRES